MKEFEYKGLKGLESLNTPTSEDIFEHSVVFGDRDRQILDFSFVDGDPTATIVDNISYFALTSSSNTQGRPPEGAELILEGYKDYDRENVVGQYQNGLNQYVYAPKFNEDGLIFLSYGEPGTAGSNIRFFRSGYVELTIKPTKENCTLLYGSQLFTTSTEAGSAATAGLQSNDDRLVVLDNASAITNEKFANINELEVSLKEGKIFLEYRDEYGENSFNYELSGNTNLVDGKWHHVVINFTKPGMIEDFGKKSNKKAIEFWVDGKLDAKDSSIHKNRQIFFPMIDWFGGLPLEVFANSSNVESPYLQNLEGWKTQDREEDSVFYIGYRGEPNSITLRIFNESAKAKIYKGSIHTYVSGINIPLSRYEIEERYSLWSGNKLAGMTSGSAQANMVEPKISSNKTKVLKLYWNNLILEQSKNGVELDNNFNANSYSVTHKTLNSPSDVYNVDRAVEKELQFLPDVRFAIKDNVIPFGPGKFIEDNYPDEFAFAIGLSGKGLQQNMGSYYAFDNFDVLGGSGFNPSEPGERYYGNKFMSPAVKNYLYSGSSIQDGDRILLTNQFNPKDNGIWVYNGPSSFLTRPSDSDSPSKLINAVVRVTDGYYKDTSWIMTDDISSLNDKQTWEELEFHPENNNVGSQPVFVNRWNTNGSERMINLQDDVDLEEYDIIVFMNYPETEDELNNHFVNFTNSEIRKSYDDFIFSLKKAVVDGKSLFVSSDKLALDLKIISEVQEVSQAIQDLDIQASTIDPFKLNESPDRYFDTHRNNKHRIVYAPSNMLNKNTYIMTDFINYVPENSYDFEEWHVKYSYRPSGILVGDEFYIPGTSLRMISSREDIPGFRNNSKKTNNLKTVPVESIISGKAVSTLSATYYVDDTAIVNPYKDNATTIVVEPGDVLDGEVVVGKIFVNFTEDTYVYSKERYNTAVIQNTDSSQETEAAKSWQYSTSRLNRKPKTTNVAGVNKYGETSPTNSGGGPFVQGQTASSSGIIRSETDKNNEQNKTSLYRTMEEEMYETAEIPTYSMTWLGLEWLSE